MKSIALSLLAITLPFLSIAQLKSFELTNPYAIELTDSCVSLLTAHPWRTLQIETDVRGNITETEGRRPIKYNEDGTFDYRFTGTWEIIEGKYIKHSFEDEKDKEVNFGGIYAVTELSERILTLTKVLTSSRDMSRTMYFETKKDDPPPIKGSYGLKPIFSAPSNLYQGKIDVPLLDSISRMSMEEIRMNNFLYKEDTIYIVAPDSLYRIKRKVQ